MGWSVSSETPLNKKYELVEKCPLINLLTGNFITKL